MSFDIPASIEPSVKQYAAAQHISTDEALLRLLQIGVRHAVPASSPSDILGAFSSDIEAATMDEALGLAMEDRERRNSLSHDA